MRSGFARVGRCCFLRRTGTRNRNPRFVWANSGGPCTANGQFILDDIPLWCSSYDFEYSVQTKSK